MSDIKEATEFEDEKTNPGTIDAAVIQHLAEGVPETLADDAPTAPIKFEMVWKEPDFDEEEPTLERGRD